MSRFETFTSTIKLFVSRATRKDALYARDLSRVSMMDFDEAYRVVLRGNKEGIEPLNIYLTMSALNVSIDDAMKAINDPQSIW